MHPRSLLLLCPLIDPRIFQTSTMCHGLVPVLELQVTDHEALSHHAFAPVHTLAIAMLSFDPWCSDNVFLAMWPGRAQALKRLQCPPNLSCRFNFQEHKQPSAIMLLPAFTSCTAVLPARHASKAFFKTPWLVCAIRLSKPCQVGLVPCTG